jgi:hypothetical protein
MAVEQHVSSEEEESAGQASKASQSATFRGCQVHVSGEALIAHLLFDAAEGVESAIPEARTTASEKSKQEADAKP